MGFLFSFGRALRLDPSVAAAGIMRVCFAQGWLYSILFIVAQAVGVWRAVLLQLCAVAVF